MSAASGCGWCETARGELVMVAAVEAGSGPGHALFACRACLTRERLVPLAEHPPGSWGGLVYRTDAGGGR